MIIDRSKQQKNLLEMLQEKNEYISAPCNGNGICGKCIVRYKRGATEPTRRDREVFSEKQLEDGYRLACQSHPVGAYEVELPESEETIEVLSEWEKQQKPDTEGLTEADTQTPAEAKTSGGIQDKNTAEGTAEKTENAIYGICIDIGTTTLAALLVNLETEADCQTAVSVNHQRAYGSDVLSRISASNSGKKWEIQRCIRQDLQKLIRELLQKEKITEQQIKRIVIAGNTTMCHLLRGFSCETLGVAPFLPVDLSWMEGSAADFLGMKELDTKVVILPGISAFVGADIMAGIAKMNMHRSEGYHLLLDIGTNGEMVLGNRERLVTCSTAAGPAFEGAKIECGMRGAAGAVDHVKFRDGKWSYTTVGNKPAVGLCGSGLIDLVAGLLDAGMLDENGALSSGQKNQSVFMLVSPELAGNERGVYLTQKDIGEVQLAKAAIAAGIQMLMERLGITEDEISSVYIAGAFGNYMDPVSAGKIGLFPAALVRKVKPVGNTAGEGAKIALVNEKEMLEMDELVRKIDFVELAASGDFQDYFIDELGFEVRS